LSISGLRPIREERFGTRTNLPAGMRDAA